jgi:hypothetical protein
MMGCNLFVLKEIPAQFLDYMQPDKYFIDPRDVMMELNENQHEFNEEEWDELFRNIQREIARTRNSIPIEKLEDLESPINIINLTSDEELFSILNENSLNDISVSDFRERLLNNSKSFPREPIKNILSRTIEDIDEDINSD